MTVLADLYAQPWDREAPRRVYFVSSPAWYFYRLGIMVGFRIAADVDARYPRDDADELDRRFLARRVNAAYRDEGRALGELWACLLGDLS